MSVEQKKTYPPSYGQRLTSHFEASKNTEFSLDDVKSLIKEFGKIEFEARKKTANILHFGKYRDKSVESVATFDKPYLEWCMKQKFMEDKQLLSEFIVKALA